MTCREQMARIGKILGFALMGAIAVGPFVVIPLSIGLQAAGLAAMPATLGPWIIFTVLWTVWGRKEDWNID